MADFRTRQVGGIPGSTDTSNLTKQISALENRVKALESALQVSSVGSIVLKSSTHISIESGTILTLKGGIIKLN